METLVHEGPGAIEETAEPWRSLVAADPAATFFHTPAYARAWLSEFSAGRSLRVVEVRDGGAPVGVAPLSHDPDGVLRFLGDLETTDYLGPVSAPEHRDAVADAVLRAAVGMDDWTTFQLHCLASDSGWPEALARAAKGAGLIVDERVQEACPQIPLGGTYDDYLAALSGKQRHEIRRKARRLTEAHPSWSVRASGGDALDPDLDAFFGMHRSSEGAKGKFLHEGMESFFRRVARAADAEGALRLHLMEVEGRPVAGTLAFAFGGSWGVYNSAYDSAMRDLAPGMVLMAETIRFAAEEGCTLFDMLRGTEPYKYRFGARDLPLIQLIFDRT